MNFNLKSEKRILYGKVVKAMDYENNVRVALLSSEKLEALGKQNAIEQESMASSQVEQLDFDSPSTPNVNANLNGMAVQQPAQPQMLDSNPSMTSGSTNKFINIQDSGPTPGDVGPSQMDNSNNPFNLPLSNVGGSDMLQVTNPQDLSTLMSIVPTNVETIPANTGASGSPFASTPIPVSGPSPEVPLQQPQQMIPTQEVPSLTDLQIPTKEVLANEPTNANENIFSSLSMDTPPVVQEQPVAQAPAAQPAAMPQPVAAPVATPAATPQPTVTSGVTQDATLQTQSVAQQASTELNEPKKITDIYEYREYVLDKADEYYQKFLDDIEAVLDQAIEQKETLGALPQTQQPAQVLDNPLINDAFTHISNITVDPGSPGMAA